MREMQNSIGERTGASILTSFAPDDFRLTACRCGVVRPGMKSM
jgi:hypothetical protein